MTWREQFETDGFAFLRGILAPEAVAAALAEWSEVTRLNADNGALLAGESGLAYGARNLLDLWPRVTELLRVEPLRAALLRVLGANAGAVRALYFDKPPGHSWALPWHKDYSVAVKAAGATGAFTKPTVKARVPHVIAPHALLDRMLTVRIHLDAMTPENGPLKVIPGSHRYYDQRNDEPRDPVTLHCRAGDVLLLRPLVTHASGHSKPDAALHRRIVHCECAAGATLPDGYEWKWFVGVCSDGRAADDVEGRR